MGKHISLLAALLITCSAPPPAPNTLMPDPPTFQRATPVTGGTRLTWKNATDEDFDLTLVARYTSGLPDGMPGATVPARGDAFGSGIVVYVGDATTFTDTELPPDCTTFTYQFWSHDKAGHWSGGGVTVTTLPGGEPPPTAPPSGLLAMRAGMTASLSWTKTAGTSTKLVRNLGTPPLSADQGTLVYEGPEQTFSEPVSRLPEGQTIFYAAFACNSCGACSVIGANATLTIVRDDAGIPDAGPDDPDGGSPLKPTMMAAVVASNGVDVSLSWVNPPAATGFTQVKVLRQLNALPTGPNDPTATTLFTGLATAANDRVAQLLPSTPGVSRTYFYVAYGCAGATCETYGSRTTFSLTMSQALKAGGYTIWWRHNSASTCGDMTNLGGCSCTNGVCTNCPAGAWWKSCDANCGTATARQLTPPQSDLEATTIRTQFMQKGIVVGRVLSSEMCRAIQSAQSWRDSNNVLHQGFDFGPPLELVKELTYFVYDEANRCTNTYNLLNETPAAGTNTAMVSHAGFNCPLIDSLAWGEAAIFKPNPGGQPTFMTRVAYNQWGALP